ncbi:hypothetical protein M9H77_06685 [Catharanthus roseus]|uniref:Uncharacterized protein n=1 Tax=Catharanthus roseus TaxID=4058 RepID=A0ACC0BSY8_CATRO|nr:hypothetical protein M9H77_06685 [Catharanthus roseus]
MVPEITVLGLLYTVCAFLAISFMKSIPSSLFVPTCQRCLPEEITMKGNENRQKQSENDENGANSNNRADLPPEVGQLTVDGRSFKSPLLHSEFVREKRDSPLRCFPKEKMMKRNENSQKCTENDENEANGIVQADLPPEVGQPTINGRKSTGHSLEWFHSIFTIQYYSTSTSITRRPNLEDLVSKYINSVDAEVKSMETVQISQTASIYNMESEMMIAENHLVVYLVIQSGFQRSMQRQSPSIVVDKEEEIAQATKESTSPT